jgi:hypothetical protein
MIGRYGGGLNDIELLLFVFLESSSRIPEDGSVEGCDNEVNARAWPYTSAPLFTIIIQIDVQYIHPLNQHYHPDTPPYLHFRLHWY